MILVDLNQVLISGLMVQIGGQKNNKFDEDLIRHMVLNILRNHIKKFKAEYGEVVLCCDNRNYWRKGIFPFYKAGRKKSREKSDLDWHMIFDILGKIKEELKQNFPYKVIDVEGAEADDIIGTLAPRYVQHENVLILSSDGDFPQLQKWNSKNSKYNIKQYNPVMKKFMTCDDPIADLKEKIIRGDKGDGIPNILSPSDSFVRDIRQKPITKGALTKLMSEDWQTWADETAKIGFSRNDLLINLENIPKEIKESIINEYDSVKPASRMKLFNYFIEKKLKNLMDVIEDY
jgi:hypothetical protein